MGTVCEIAVDGSSSGEGQIRRAFDEAQRIEAFLSTWRDDSELSRLNRGEAAASAELRSLLEVTEGWRERTGGAFEPRVRPLIDAWRSRHEGANPSAEVIRAALASISERRAPIEEGAFGKGYAIDRMLAAIDAPNVVINFGGQLGVRGTSRVTVADPRDRTKSAAAFTLRNASLSTSSGSEKSFDVNGRRYTHIIDPRSGEALPERGSVSVVAPDALSADILSTALYVMGPLDGLRWADENSVAALFIDPENNVRVSNAFVALVRDLHLTSKD
jgi:thiamine biosynthesis lipoprotein